MKIYTKTGDRGETHVAGGDRVSKDSVRLEACGTVDELSAALGIVRAEPLPEPLDGLLQQIQHELGTAASELATAGRATREIATLRPEQVQAVEAAIDRYAQTLPPLCGFILPAGTRAAAALHLARAICRRAERRLVTLVRTGNEEISPTLNAYLNRLGDLLFVLARTVNARAGVADAPWEQSGSEKAPGN